MIPTAPLLTYMSTHTSTTSMSKQWSGKDDSIIDISGPTPKKLRTYGSKCTVNDTVRITLNNNNEIEEDFYGGGLSDYDER